MSDTRLTDLSSAISTKPLVIPQPLRVKLVYPFPSGTFGTMAGKGGRARKGARRHRSMQGMVYRPGIAFGLVEEDKARKEGVHGFKGDS